MGGIKTKSTGFPAFFLSQATLFHHTLLADILFCSAPFGSLSAGFVGTLRLVRFHVFKSLFSWLYIFGEYFINNYYYLF